jgi:hypothetical protein
MHAKSLVLLLQKKCFGSESGSGRIRTFSKLEPEPEPELNFSKVRTGTGTVINSYGSTTLRAAPYPKLIFKQNYSEKPIKFYNFSTKNAQF